MAVEGVTGTLGPVLTLLAGAVVAVPLFRRLGLGSVLGYFAAGLLVGPSALGLFADPETILHISELGVVMFLFIIGLEIRPQRLWALRREIFGLGLGQVLLCGALLTGAAVALGFAPIIAFIAAAGFVLSSTAVVMQILRERGEAATAQGQQAISILLLEDLAIVPLLAVVALLAPAGSADTGNPWLAAAVAVAALAALVAAGRWLLDPFFALLAKAHTREVLTAGALLVVLGSAFLMEVSGLSMAMGAFMAGVLLSGSSYRHQIEADVEPFKGILMGLFFLAVGMSLNLNVVLAQWQTTLVLLVCFMLLKAAGIFAMARLAGSNWRQGILRMALFAQGGEFAFVLYAAAYSSGLFDSTTNALFSAVIIMSMALTPVVLLFVDRFLPSETASASGLSPAEDLHGRALMIGFGRFGQIASQAMLARGFELSIIENDPDRIREAARFGFKVYFGDGGRLDILRSSGAAEAEAILVCVNGRTTANHIVDLIKAEFPLAKILVRAYDRGHSLELIRAGVDEEVRETVESALAFGTLALEHLGVSSADAREVTEDIRRRDRERLTVQVNEGYMAGASLMHRNAPVPEPLTAPRQVPADGQGQHHDAD